MANQFMRADEVAKELGISRSYAYKLIRQLNQEITKEDYDRWRYYYPAFDDTSVRVPIPTEEPTRSKRGRKPKNKD